MPHSTWYLESMPAAEMDLRTLLDQDRRMMLDLLEQSSKLVLEISATHYWTVYYIQVFGQLNNITANLSRLIESCQPNFAEGPPMFGRPEALRLWKSASGLWRAVPPELAKLTEQLARRRRQRIKGEKIEEAPDVTPEQISTDLERYRVAHAQLASSVERLAASIEAVPTGLSPTDEMLAAGPAVPAAPTPPAPQAGPMSTTPPATPKADPLAPPSAPLNATPGPALTLPPAPGTTTAPNPQPKPPVAEADELSPA